MFRPTPQPTPSDRQQAWSRVRTLTRGAVLAATGLTAVIGITVAKEHTGTSTTPTTSGSGSGPGATTTVPTSSSSSGSSASSGNAGNSGTTSNTGNSGSGVSSSPSITFSRPSVTSGGSSR